MHNFVSAILVQAVKATNINEEQICVTLGNKFKVLSIKLAKLSILFAFGAAQTVWCYAVPELSATNHSWNGLAHSNQPKNQLV